MLWLVVVVVRSPYFHVAIQANIPCASFAPRTLRAPAAGRCSPTSRPRRPSTRQTREARADSDSEVVLLGFEQELFKPPLQSLWEGPRDVFVKNSTCSHKLCTCARKTVLSELGKFIKEIGNIGHKKYYIRRKSLKWQIKGLK